MHFIPSIYIKQFIDFIKRKKENTHYLYQEFLNDEICTKIIFGNEINTKKENLHKFSSGKLSKHIRIINVPENIYYRGISFSNIIFDGINLNHICFHNCTFYSCEFKNVTTHNPNKYSNSKLNISGFNFCDFNSCKFSDCNFNHTLWSIGKFSNILFENTKFYNSMFHRNSFSNVQFKGNCMLYDTCIIRPSGQFDIKFYNENGMIKMTPNSYISNFDYKDKINIMDYEIYSIHKKSHYKNVASTYFALEKLCDNNCLTPQYINYYYQRKKAETRSKKILKSIPSYLNELIIGYGEYPFNSLISMMIIILIFSFVYLFTGFTNIDNYNIMYDFDITHIFFISKLDIGNWLHSLYLSFFTLITVGQGSAHPTTPLSQIASSIELLLGAVLVTLFTATLFRKYTK